MSDPSSPAPSAEEIAEVVLKYLDKVEEQKKAKGENPMALSELRALEGRVRRLCQSVLQPPSDSSSLF